MTIAAGQVILASDVNKAVNHAQSGAVAAQTTATAASALADTADTDALAALATANTAAANAAAARAPVAGLQQQIDNAKAANDANVSLTDAETAQLGALENRIAALEAGGGVVIPPPPPGQVPNAPTAPRSTAVTPASVSLAATAPAFGGAADNYTIQRALAGTGTYIDAITVPAPTVTGTLPGLAASTSYDIGVVAKNATGAGPRSAIITRPTLAVVTPPPTGNAPARASAQGYNTQTFGPSLILSGPGQNWLPAPESGGPGTFTNNTDGSVTINPPSNAGDGRQWETATCNIGSYLNFTGRGFGGGGYFVNRMKWANGAGINPAWWSNDIEGQCGFGAANTPVQWPGQGGDYNLWFEPDFMEAGGADFGSAMWQWYGSAGSQQGFQPLDARTSVSNTNVYHDFGFLWVPATSAHGGFAEYDVDGRVYGRVNWPFRANRNTLPGPPPTSGGGSTITATVCSDLDWRHLFMMIGSAPGLPVTVLSISVWQTDASKNISA